MKVGDRVRVLPTVVWGGPREGTIVGFTGMVCPDGAYIDLGVDYPNLKVPGIPFDVNTELELIS